MGQPIPRPQALRLGCVGSSNFSLTFQIGTSSPSNCPSAKSAIHAISLNVESDSRGQKPLI